MIQDLLPTAILVPSLNRPQRLKALVENIHETTPEEHFIVFCVGDPESKEILDDLGESYLDDTEAEDKRYVTRMNKLIEYLMDANTVFFGSDDVIHQKRWLHEALLVMETEPKPSVVVVNDLRNRNGTQAAVRRTYLARAVVDAPELAFHPGYLHNFADNEMFFTAWMRGEYARAMDSHVEHLHPVFGAPNAMPWDDTYRNAQSGWEADKALWETRAQIIDQILR